MYRLSIIPVGSKTGDAIEEKESPRMSDLMMSGIERILEGGGLVFGLIENWSKDYDTYSIFKIVPTQEYRGSNLSVFVAPMGYYPVHSSLRKNKRRR